MDRIVEVGSIWKHFKGREYKIIAIAKDSETLKQLVIYEHDNDVWARDMDMFLSEVDHNKYKDIKQKYRFEKVKEN